MHSRTAIITGGTGGIGRATAMGLGRLGANVAITGRDAVRAEDTAHEIREATCSQSKLANVLFIHELARRQPSVTANALHPTETAQNPIGRPA